MPANTTADSVPGPHDRTRIRLDLFERDKGLDRGRGRFIEGTWYLAKCFFFLSPLPWPSLLKSRLLRLFGATVGQGVVIKPRVNIHLPWKLVVGDHVWIGEEVCLLNFEPIVIGDHACLSQRAFLCTGNHDYRDPTFRYRNAPITVGAGAWLGAQTFVSPGVTIGSEAVVTAGSVVTRDLPPGNVCSGNPCAATRRRWNEKETK